jgi:hypothetical protein
MKHEYHEGSEAAAKFEKMAKQVFRAPSLARTNSKETRCS